MPAWLILHKTKIGRFARAGKAIAMKIVCNERPFSINVRFACAGEAFIVMDSRHARVSRFSKPAPPARGGGGGIFNMYAFGVGLKYANLSNIMLGISNSFFKNTNSSFENTNSSFENTNSSFENTNSTPLVTITLYAYILVFPCSTCS